MKRLLSVTAFTAMLTLLRMSTGFIIAKVVATYTGPTGIAMLGQIQSVINVLNGIINAPAGACVIRYTAENIDEGYDKCSPWWKASLQWVILLLSIVIPISLLLSGQLSSWLFNNSEFYWVIIIACCSLPFAVISTLINSVINGQQKYKRYVTLGMISTLISAIITISLVYFYSINGALIAVSLNSGVIGCVMIAISIKQPWFKVKYWWGKTELEQRKKIGGYVLMAITSALTAPISLILVRNILVSNVGWEVTGQWQAVWKISEAYLSIVTISLSTYYLPKLSGLIKIGDVIKEVNKTAFVIMPLVVFLGLCIYFFRDLVISLLFTDDFINARNLFLIQLSGDVMKILSWLYAYPMIARGATKLFIATEIIFSILLVILSYIFIHYYGVSGANMAYFINYIIYFICIFVLLKTNKIK